jgi:hypothetical protein
MKLRPALLLLILVFASCLTPNTSDAARPATTTDRAVTSSITAHGMRLTLSLRRGTYPRTALVRVRLTLMNISHHAIAVGSTAAPECAWFGPGVQVLDSAGQVLYPPATEWIMASCGPRIMPKPLAPGRTVHHTTFAILLGSAIRAVATLSTATPGTATTIETPLLHLHMIDETTPQLTVPSQPSLHLTVTPATPKQRGAFLFVFGILCPGPNPPSLVGGFGTAVPGWQRASTHLGRAFHLEAQCANPVRWVFVGGWLNHPVATVDYRGSG